MSRGLNFRSNRGCSGWAIAGWVLMVVAGIALAWYGFTASNGGGPFASLRSSPTPTASATPLPSPTPMPMPTLPPTDTPVPAPTQEPTAVPPTATPVAADIVAGTDGANVRSGPGTNFTRLGYLDPGAQAPVTGRYSDWWQIDYAGTPAWVYAEIVTPSHTDAVSEVQPPSSPTSPPAPPTDIPVPTDTPLPAATPTPEQPAEVRGLRPNDYSVEGAPGPFGAGSSIWFNMEITNTTPDRVYFDALGTWVQETGQFQKSWTDQKFSPSEHFTWRDHIEIPDAGTYNLWMTICFTDDTCTNLMGPVTVNVE